MKRTWINLLLIGLLASCIGEEFDTDKLSDEFNLTTGIALPLAVANITMGDILSEDTDYVKYYLDDDGNERIMLFQESDSVAHIGLNDMIKISSQNVDIPVPYSAFLIQPQISQQLSFPLSIPNANLSTVDISYTISMTGSELAEPITVNMTFPSSVSSNSAIAVDLQSNESIVQTYTMRLDLSNNEIPIEVSIQPNNGTVNSNAVGNIAISMSDFNINYVKGSIGEIPISINNGQYDFDFDVFNNFPDGIEFDDPRFKILVNNSTPFKGLFDAQITGELESKETIELITPELMSISECPSHLDVVSDTITIDKTNSNFKDFLFEVPKRFTYTGNLLLNPEADLSSEIELDDQSTIYMGYVVEVPLEVVINSTLDIDTIDMSDNDILQELQKAKLVINSENGFPFEAEAFIDFYDSESNTITETIKANIIDAAEVDSRGIVSGKSMKKEEIELNTEQIEKLNTIDKLIIRLGLKSSNYEQNQPVVILTNNELAVQISLKGEVSL